MKTNQKLTYFIIAILIFTGIGLEVSKLKKEKRPVGKLYMEPSIGRCPVPDGAGPAP